MRKISSWAKAHIWQSRLIIVLIYLGLNVIGIFTGKLFTEIDISIPEFIVIGCLILTIFIWVIYPDKKVMTSNCKFPETYTFRKACDFSLGVITFVLIVYAGNKWQYLFIKTEKAQATKIIRIKDSSLNNHPLITNFLELIKREDISKLNNREKVKMVKEQIKKVKHDKDTSKEDKTLLIILSIVAALVLLFGLASLSCSIACAGSEALAILVALGGTFLIVLFLLKIIKKIKNRPEKTKEANNQEP